MIEMEGMYKEDIKIRSNNKQWRKLVDYYNQMREEKFGEKGYFEYKNRFDKVHIISKNMGFIEWLVLKDKIEWFNVYKKEEAEKIDICIYGKEGKEEKTDWLLMLLSIQDNPIEFLISILR